MTMTKPQAMKIAHATMEIRPDWAFPGIMAALAKAPEGQAYGTTLIAMATCAMDPGAQTPAAFTNPVYQPSWSAQSNAEKATARTVEMQRQRSNRVRAELADIDRTAASIDRVREIRANTPWPVRVPGIVDVHLPDDAA